MKRPLIIVIILCAVLILVAFFYYVRGRDLSSDLPTGQKYRTVQLALDSGKELVCLNLEKQGTSSTYYFGQGKIRIENRTPENTQFMIFTSDTVFVWSSETENEVIVSVSDDFSIPYKAVLASDFRSFSCTEGPVGEDVFTPKSKTN